MHKPSSDLLRSRRFSPILIFALSVVLVSAFSIPIIHASPSVINVSNNAGDSTNPRVATNKNNVYVVWQDVSSGHLQIFGSISHDGGLTFSVPTNLSNDAGNAQDPHIATRGSHVYLVWQDSTAGHNQICYTTSNDAGTTWSTPVNLSNDAGAATNPIAVARGSNTHKNAFVAWQDTSLGNSQIFTRESNDNGMTWSATINVSNDASNAVNARIQNRENSLNVYVVWTESSGGNSAVMVSTSTDLGQTYGVGQQVNPDTGNAIQGRLKEFGSTGTSVYVVWADNASGNYDVYLFKVA